MTISPQQPAKRFLLELVTLGALLAIAWFATEALERDPTDGTDQAEWTAISVVHVRQLGGKLPSGAARDESAGTLDPDPWRQGVQGTTFGWPNPSLHKIVWGLACDSITPERVFPGTFLKYHQGELPKVQRAVQPLVPAIERAQDIVALASALCAVLLFVLGRALAGQVGGFAAFALWLFHPMVRIWSHQARPDFGMLALFLAVPALVLLLTPVLRGARGKSWQFAAWILMGLLAGMCAGTKLNGALAGFFLALCVPLLALRDNADERPARLPLIATSLSGGLVAAATLFALFPYLWSAPLEHLGELREFWSTHMAGHQDRWESFGGTATRTLGEKVAMMVSRLFGSDDPLSGWTGFRAGYVLLSTALVVLGLRAAGKSWFAGEPNAQAPARTALLWIVVAIVGTTLWLPLEWDRYFFPGIAAAALAEGVMLGLLVELVRNRIRGRRTLLRG